MAIIDKEFKKNQELLLWCIVICCCSALVARYCFFIKQPYLWGPDGYYYAMQIKFFVQTGMFKIADRSLLLPLMGWTAKVGLTSEQVIIGWVLIIQLLSGVSVIIAQRLVNKRFLIFPSFFLLMYIILSPTLSYLSIVFPKYAFALIFLPFWSLGLINPRYWPLSIVAISLSGISHLSMIGIAVLVIGVAILRGEIRFSWVNTKTLILTAVIVCFILFGLVSRKYFVLSDLQRFSWDGLKPPLWTLVQRGGIPLMPKVEVIISVVMIWGVLLFHKNLKYEVKVGALWAPFVVFLNMVPMGSGESMGIAERLSMLLPMIMVCILFGVNHLNLLLKRVFLIGLFCGVVLTSVFPEYYYHLVYPNDHNFKYSIYDQIITEIETREIPMLIAHQGLNYFYKYQTMKESFPYEPETHWPKEKIWRIVFGVKATEWGYYLPESFLWGSGLLWDLSGDYSLIREDGWNEFRNRVKKESQDQDLRYRVLESWLNPNQKRPEFSRSRSAASDVGEEFSAYPKD